MVHLRGWRGFGSVSIIGLVFGLLYAQTTESIPVDADRGAASLTRWLHALKTRASLILITAHPDDEDGGMLALETRGAGARAVLLSLNRGEGGQNATSPDLYDALGLVRTQELLAADRYYGVDQYWTPAIDFGFTKTREEALDKWGHDRVLADVVRVIRMTRPLVVTSVFVGAPTDGHGQHQVAGQLAQEAFAAAGDPNRFPEQIREGLRPWSPLKVYAHVPFFSATPLGMYDYATDKYVPVRFFDYIHKTWSTETPATNLEIAEGDYAAAAGLTYLQIGREGLGFQKSQNDGIAIPPPAAFASAYHRYDSRVPAAVHEESFFDGIDVSIAGIGSLAPSPPDFLKSGLAEIARLADQASSQYQPDRPHGIAPALADGLSATRALMGRVRAGSLPEPGKSDILFELGVKEEQFEHALAESLGLSFQVTVAADRPQGPLGPFAPASPPFTIAIPGQTFGVQAVFLNQSPEAVKVEGMSLEASDGQAWKIESRGDARFSLTVPPDAALTRPYFTRPDEEQAYYDLTDPRYRTLSLPPYPLAATVRVSYRGASVHLSQVVQSVQRIPGLGMEPQPLLLGPAISVTVAPSAGAVPVGAASFAFTCTVHSNVKGPARGTLRLSLPAGWHSTPETAAFSMDRDGEDQTVAFSVIPDSVQPGEHRITAVAEYQGKKYEEGYRLVGYPGLRPYPYYRAAVYRAVGVDVKTPAGLRIGYLPGTGDDVPQALENLGSLGHVVAGARQIADAQARRGFHVHPDRAVDGGAVIRIGAQARITDQPVSFLVFLTLIFGHRRDTVLSGLHRIRDHREGHGLVFAIAIHGEGCRLRRRMPAGRQAQSKRA